MQRGSGLQGLVGLIPKTMADTADLSHPAHSPHQLRGSLQSFKTNPWETLEAFRDDTSGETIQALGDMQSVPLE